MTVELQEKLQAANLEVIKEKGRNEQLELECKTLETKCLAFEELCEKLKRDISSFKEKGEPIPDVEVQQERTRRNVVEQENRNLKDELKALEIKLETLQQSQVIAPNQDIVRSLEHEKEFWRSQYLQAKGIDSEESRELAKDDHREEEKSESSTKLCVISVPKSTQNYIFSKLQIPDLQNGLFEFIKKTFDPNLLNDFEDQALAKHALVKLISIWMLKNWRKLKPDASITGNELEEVSQMENSMDLVTVLKIVAVQYETTISMIKVGSEGMSSSQIPPEKEIKFEKRVVLIQDCREPNSVKYEIVIAKTQKSKEEFRVFDFNDTNSKEQAIKLVAQMTNLL